MKKKPVPGQTLYRLNIGNAARNCEQVLVPVEVKKVGRKYFTCGINEDNWEWSEHHLDTWREKSSYPDYCLYETEQEYLDMAETANALAAIREKIMYKYRKLSLHQLRRIMAIIEEG